jgi:hypothetical protein
MRGKGEAEAAEPEPEPVDGVACVDEERAVAAPDAAAAPPWTEEPVPVGSKDRDAANPGAALSASGNDGAAADVVAAASVPAAVSAPAAAGPATVVAPAVAGVAGV